MPVQRQDNSFIVLEVVGALLLLDQVALLLPEILPAHPGSTTWRYGFFGLLISRATPLLFADLLLLFGAYKLEQARLLRVAGVVHILLALGLLLGLGLFGLDTIQVRKQLKPQFRSGMTLSAARAMLMSFALAVFAAWAGIRVFMDGGRIKQRKVSAGRSESGFLVTRDAEPSRAE